MSLPAHSTKHLPLLRHPFPPSLFHLAQHDNGIQNGTALWLGAQCLALYLAQAHSSFNHHKSSTSFPTALELGSGIGFTALALASLGWHVLATDLPHVINTVLASNIRNNASNLPPSAGLIQIRHLDWLVSPHSWSWNDPLVIASPSSSSTLPEQLPPSHLIQPPFDLIISADTVYDSALVQPLLRTCHALSTLSIAASPDAHVPTVLLCLERRDPALVDNLIYEAHHTWNFIVHRIPHRRLAKIIQKSNPAWTKDDWHSIEIWKLKLAPLSAS
ncbi:hypothetical protein BDQ17DRAFT_1353395 [Cyathus striatus]|nr:hypothetical protein BDQ17DRAFT_1353395 [Cyathus striatus]